MAENIVRSVRANRLHRIDTIFEITEKYYCFNLAILIHSLVD
jgi:hypothetical protein